MSQGNSANASTPKRVWPLVLLSAVALLAACAPTAQNEDRVEVAQLTEPITFYPYQTGARWEYLRDRARLSDPRAATLIEGPTVVESEVWISFVKTRPGYHERGYRRVNSDGVFLHSRVVLGITTIKYDPPLQEFPSEGSLRVGAQWTGRTNVTVSNVGSPQTERFTVQYVYTVVDRRTVSTPAGALEVFVIDLTTRNLDENENIVEETTAQTWFAPFVGEVRTNQAWVLVASNVLGAANANAQP